MMRIITAARDAELETTRELYLTSTRKSTRSLVGSRQSGSTCDLPSLVDVGKCTSDRVCGKPFTPIHFCYMFMNVAVQ